MTTEPKKYKVLVVDDDEVVADTLVLVLIAGGYNAVAVYDPKDALSFAKMGSFDLLFTDVVMPRMSGIDLAIATTEAGFISKVLLISGMFETSDLLEDARSRGYNFEIIPKPMQPSEIIAKVAELLCIPGEIDA